MADDLFSRMNSGALGATGGGGKGEQSIPILASIKILPFRDSKGILPIFDAAGFVGVDKATQGLGGLFSARKWDSFVKGLGQGGGGASRG